MTVYTLPRPTPLERSLRKRFSSTDTTARWTIYPNKEETVVVSLNSSDQGVVVLGRTAPPAENLFRTLLLVDALKHAGERNIIIAIPYFGYGRHDRLFVPGGSVAGPLILLLLKAAGAASLVTVDSHSKAINAAGSLPITNLSMMPLMAECMKRSDATTIVSPDRGGRARAEVFARSYNGSASLVWFEKVRSTDGSIASVTQHGECIGDSAIIVDDILDTGRTIEAAANALRSQGIQNISLCVTHPLFTGPAAERIARLGFEQIVVTNTVPLHASVRNVLSISVLDVAAVIGDGVRS